jgi:hypothetical protein
MKQINNYAGEVPIPPYLELNLNRNSEPRTPEEMRKLEPLAFERAEKNKKDLYSGGENIIFKT